MNTPFLETIRLTLTPLSPIHLGCGEEFEPTGYVIEDEVLFGFDPSQARYLPGPERERLGELGSKADQQGIQRFFRNNSASFTPYAHLLLPVCKAVAQHYAENIGQVAQIENNGRKVSNQFYLTRTAHGLDHRAYIPGSALKGCLRTGLLDLLNNSKIPRFASGDKVKSTACTRYETELLGGDFKTSPLRLVKPSDLTPVGPVHQSILWVANYYKQPRTEKNGTIKRPRGISTRNECINAGQYRCFSGQLVLQHPKTPDKTLTNAPLQQLIKSTNAYHLPRFKQALTFLAGQAAVNPQWVKDMHTLLTEGGLENALRQGHAMLVRLGRFTGAESKTLSGDGVAQIKLMEAKGKPATYASQTRTYWLAEGDDRGMPLGWAVLELGDTRELPALQTWCATQEHARTPIREHLAALQKRQAEQRQQLIQNTEKRAAQAAAQAAQEAEQHAQAARRAQLSPALQAVDAWQTDCINKAQQLQGRKERPNTALHTRASQLVQQALENWPPDERRTLAAAIEQHLPQVVALTPREVHKKLKLEQLRAD
ncbi:MAG: RAMP superfamily CRISPR-associated protein [Rhodocyclales bacterium]|nr:RAMP superfamily CRISPR-associated protein [Rhodocyclales bacterium]